MQTLYKHQHVGLSTSEEILFQNPPQLSAELFSDPFDQDWVTCPHPRYKMDLDFWPLQWEVGHGQRGKGKKRTMATGYITNNIWHLISSSHPSVSSLVSARQ